jgi:hypothetical protein
MKTELLRKHHSDVDVLAQFFVELEQLSGQESNWVGAGCTVTSCTQMTSAENIIRLCVYCSRPLT